MSNYEMKSARIIFINAIASPHFVPLGQRITINYPLIAMRSKLYEQLYGNYM